MEWISIEDRLPTMQEYQKNNGRFLVSDGNTVKIRLFDVYEGEFLFYLDDYEIEYIKWRELPEP